MFRNIVVPLDGSKLSEEALDAAVYFARAYEARLHLVQVCELPITTVEAMGVSYFEMRDECLAQGEAYIQKKVAELQLGDRAGGKVLLGHPADQLLEFCREVSADLVLMTSHGLSGLERWLLGSVVENFARRSTCPVLVLRAGHKVTLPLGRKILVPLDGSPLAEEILPVAEHLAAKAGGELVLLRSHHDTVSRSFEFASHDLYPSGDGKRELEQGEKLAADYLKEKAHSLEGVKVSHTLTDAYPPEAILEGARAEEVDLIALTSHGATGLAKWVFGSVAEKVLRHADRPVLVVKSDWTATR